ncbi:MAG: helix-turn-helix domain-containing protein [Vicinamibacterales bacterium]
MVDLIRLGQNVRFQRKGRGWSLSELEERSGGVPKAYISDLENGSGGKPNIQYLFQVATAFGTTIDALIRGPEAEPTPEQMSLLPPGLQDFAQEENLTDDEVQMLAGLNFRGNRPRDKASWRAIYDVIKLASNQK